MKGIVINTSRESEVAAQKAEGERRRREEEEREREERERRFEKHLCFLLLI